MTRNIKQFPPLSHSSLRANAVSKAIYFFMLLASASAFAANPFHMGKVQYFPENKQRLKESVDQMQQGIDWREPVMGMNGTMTEYTPPGPVLRLLENPTEANAREYLMWQKIKLERIVKAQHVVEQLKIEKTP